MADMYRCMLNKGREQAQAIQVPLREYTRPLTRYVRKARPGDVSDPGAAFVLFHADLVEAGRCLGLLERSTAHEMWTVVARHSEPWPEDEDDAEPEIIWR